MESVAFSHILDTKVINKQAEYNGVPFVAPQVMGGAALVVAVLFETGLKEDVGEGSLLREFIYVIADFEVDPAISMDVVL